MTLTPDEAAVVLITAHLNEINNFEVLDDFPVGETPPEIMDLLGCLVANCGNLVKLLAAARNEARPNKPDKTPAEMWADFQHLRRKYDLP